MEHRMADFYVHEGRTGLLYRTKYQFSIHYNDSTVIVVATRHISLLEVTSSAGTARRSPEDTFDLRIGVPLALKRALRDFKHANRPAIMRAFFQLWPEAHPQYKQPHTTLRAYAPKEGDLISVMTVERGLSGPAGEAIRVLGIDQRPYVKYEPSTHECPCCGLRHSCP